MKSLGKDTRMKIATVLFVLHLLVPFVVGNMYQVKPNMNKLSVEKLDSLLRLRREDPYRGSVNNLLGKPGEGYYLEVDIGTPKQKLNILVDTGSSNFAVACASHPDINTFFKKDQSSTYEDTGQSVNVPYTEGSWDGQLGRDYVTIASLPNSSVMADIACITESEGFFINNSNWQGIMGLAYAAIIRPDTSVIPVFDSMVSSGKVHNLFSVQLCGIGHIQPNPKKTVGGSIMFGSYDPAQTGTLFATPLVKEWYYEVVIVDMEVDGQSLAMDCKEYNFGKTIVDTGTTNLRLPVRVFNKVVSRMKEFTKKTSENPKKDGFWNGSDILCWEAGRVKYEEFPTVTLVLPSSQNTAFKLILAPQQYLRAVGEENDDSPGNDCYKFGISSLESGAVIGAIMLEGFYVVFDRTNKQVLFGNSNCSVVNPSAAVSSIVGNITYKGNYKDCEYFKPAETSQALTIVGYVMAGVCGLCLIPLIILTVQWQLRRCRCLKPRRHNSDASDLLSTR